MFGDVNRFQWFVDNNAKRLQDSGAAFCLRERMHIALDFMVMGRTKFILLLLIAVVLAMLFVTLNSQTVTIELALLSLRLPLGLAVVTAIAIGLIAGVLMRGAWVAELLSERGRLRRALKAAEAKARTQAGE